MNPMIFAGLKYGATARFRKENELKYKSKKNDELERILDEVCKYMEINVSDVKSKNRMLKTKIARFYYCYLAKLLTEASLQQIGNVVYRHHATVIHAKDTVSDWLSYDKEVINHLEELETLIMKK